MFDAQDLSNAFARNVAIIKMQTRSNRIDHRQRKCSRKQGRMQPGTRIDSGYKRLGVRSLARRVNQERQ